VFCLQLAFWKIKIEEIYRFAFILFCLLCEFVCKKEGKEKESEEAINLKR